MANIYGYGDNCYGRGDYYRGDYYRGDPGLFGTIGGFLKKAAGVAVGFATGGPGGALGALTGRGGPPQLRIGLPTGQAGQQAFQGLLPPPPQSTAMVPYAMATQRGLCMTPQGGKLGRWNKSTYVTRGGGTSRWPQQLLVHPKGTECVRPRRMNVCNPRALRRALTRASGFAKIARRYVAVSKRFKSGKRRRKR